MTVVWRVIPKRREMKKGMTGLPVRAMAGVVGIIPNLEKWEKSMTVVWRVIPKRREMKKGMTGLPVRAMAGAVGIISNLEK